MAAKPATTKAYLAAASPRYRAAHRVLGQVVRRVFPAAKPVFAYGMPGWRARRPAGAPGPTQAGTMGTDHTLVLLVERRTSLTAHLWWPGDYYILDDHRRALAKVGLKLGRGCLVWSRVGDFPAEALGPILAEVKARDAHAAAKGPAK